MKVVILAGGLGTRLMEETTLRPKPMVEIGGKPILWHIMKIYSSYGLNDFVICLGYKGYVVKEYFSNYFLHNTDVTFDMANDRVISHQSNAESWRVTLVDTGETTQTGGRLKRIRPYLDENEPFCMTYGDGVADIDIAALLSFHRSHGRPATVTAVRPPGRFGVLDLDGARVMRFDEKPEGERGWINGGFFVLEPRLLDLVSNDQEPWERAPLRSLAEHDQLRAYRHETFWQPMDTLRDKNILEELWSSDHPPWKSW